MKGIILHGGHGTRLRPLTFARPKQLLPIANIPMSQYGLELLREAGIKDIAIIIGGNNSSKVRDYYGDGNSFGVNITYVEQDEPKGISHAIGLCEDFIGNEKFVVFLGDNILLKSITEYVSEFEKSNDEAKILLSKVSNPNQFGIADITNDGKIKKIIEKPNEPPTDLAVIGVYFLTPVIFDVIKKLKPSWRDELEITDALQNLLELKKQISYEIITNYWKDTGMIDDIIDANKIILENMYKDNENIMIGKNVQIDQNSKLIYPVLIGDNCIIEGKSVIGPNVSIGSNTYLKNCTIQNSIIMNNCLIHSDILLDNCIIPYNSTITSKNEKKSFLLCENSKLEL